MLKRSIGCALAVAVTLVPAVPASATPPGTNGMIVWLRETARTPARLWVANPDGTAARQVFAKPRRYDFEGAFSTTDPNLVFWTRASNTPFGEDIFSGNLATGDVTRIRRPRRADIAPTVSPDGTKIAYFAVRRPRRLDEETPPPPERIHVMNVDGGGDRAITPRRRRSIDPDWSPDGSRIVYTEARIRVDQAQNRLMIMNADGSGRRALTGYGGADEVNPKWMPDGASIVFERLRQRGNKSDILAMNPDGSGVRTILSTPAWETNPVPSPDGTRILFGSDRDIRRPGRLSNGFELYTMAVDGADIVRLTNNRQADIFPDWQRLP
jgi:Tol biopolymer transport system component